MEKHIKPHSVLNNYMLALGFQMKNIYDEKHIYVNSNSHRQGFLDQLKEQNFKKQSI